ncbi:hypothetical protein [Pedobacter psychrodurus]|uniref:hypothetical protein n=1 Tax=Pedobacter psychrodurus TaxID=2530456 RepID=UPI00293015CD|nr:hypothetical protein [Pedobacter psychrodurus]
MFPADPTDHRRLTRFSAGISEISGKKNMCDMFPADQTDHRRLSRFSAGVGEISGKKNVRYVSRRSKRSPQILIGFFAAIIIQISGKKKIRIVPC